MLLVSDSLTRHAARTPDRTCLIVGDAEVSWSELEDLTNRAANALIDRGVHRGSYVSLLARNRLEHVVTYFATARIGAVLSPINYWLRPSEIAELLREVRPSAIVTEPEWFDVVGPLATSVPVISLDSAEDGFDAWDAALAAASPEPPKVDVEEDDPHIVFYTSGSTGNPKGVLKTQRGHVRNAMQFALALGLDEDDRGICGFPLFNVGGYESILHKYFFVGGSVVVLPRFEPPEVLAAIEKHRVTAALFNPTHFRMLLDSPSISEADLSSLRLCYIGGMVTTEELLREVGTAFGIGMEGLFHIYGQSEGPPLITTLHGRDCERKIGSIGRPVPGVDARLFDDAGEVVGAGDGEIRVRADDVMVGYLNNATATAETLVDGWLRTGDLARRDEDGFLYIVGRIKDIIRTGGQTVYPSEVEAVLLEHPDIAEACVIGTPDPSGVWGEQVCAVVVPVTGRRLELDEVHAFVRARLAGYKAPTRLEVVTEIPKTAAHKVAKAELLTRFGSVFDS